MRRGDILRIFWGLHLCIYLVFHISQLRFHFGPFKLAYVRTTPRHVILCGSVMGLLQVVLLIGLQVMPIPLHIMLDYSVCVVLILMSMIISYQFWKIKKAAIHYNLFRNRRVKFVRIAIMIVTFILFALGINVALNNSDSQILVAWIIFAIVSFITMLTTCYSYKYLEGLMIGVGGMHQTDSRVKRLRLWTGTSIFSTFFMTAMALRQAGSSQIFAIVPLEPLNGEILFWFIARQLVMTSFMYVGFLPESWKMMKRIGDNLNVPEMMDMSEVIKKIRLNSKDLNTRISVNGITVAAELSTFCDALRQNTRIKRVSFRGCMLGTVGTEALADHIIHNHCSIETVEITDDSSLDSTNWGTLTQSIRESKSLRKFSFDQSRIPEFWNCGNMVEAFAIAIAYNSSLCELVCPLVGVREKKPFRDALWSNISITYLGGRHNHPYQERNLWLKSWENVGNMSDAQDIFRDILDNVCIEPLPVALIVVMFEFLTGARRKLLYERKSNSMV